MKNLIQSVTHEIQLGQSANFQQTLLRAMLLFEKFYHSGDWRGIEPEVDDAEVSPESIGRLRDALIAFAQTNREHPDTASALHALSKCWGCALREFFLMEMKLHFDARRMFPLSQPEGALFHFGGGTFHNQAPGETGDEGYLEACRRFLEQNLR
jgi:hypothetical protein